MAIIATGSKTIIDLSDGKLLTVYLSSNHPKSQMYDPNPNANPVFTPNWNSTSGDKSDHHTQRCRQLQQHFA